MRRQHPKAVSHRRTSTRYPLALEVRYTTSGEGVPAKTGSGLSVDRSSSELSLITDTPLLLCAPKKSVL